MFKELKKRQEGFTIIEVMIVLVIAAVILLIVFLAVPALQRNSRNTQVKNEAAQVLSAAAEFSSNGNGCVPGGSKAPCGTAAADGPKIIALTKNKNLTTLNIVAGTGTMPTLATVTGTPSTAYLITGAKCVVGTPATATPTGASTRQVALLYSSETGASGAATVACTESGI